MWEASDGSLSREGDLRWARRITFLALFLVIQEVYGRFRERVSCCALATFQPNNPVVGMRVESSYWAHPNGWHERGRIMIVREALSQGVPPRTRKHPKRKG